MYNESTVFVDDKTVRRKALVVGLQYPKVIVALLVHLLQMFFYPVERHVDAEYANRFAFGVVQGKCVRDDRCLSTVFVVVGLRPMAFWLVYAADVYFRFEIIMCFRSHLKGVYSSAWPARCYRFKSKSFLWIVIGLKGQIDRMDMRITLQDIRQHGVKFVRIV